MEPGLRRLFGALLAMLPLAAVAQTPVDAPDRIIKSGNLAYMAGFNRLYRLDLSTGAATVVGTGFGTIGGAAVSDVKGLTFAPDGTLYAFADSPQALFRINTATGRASLVGQFRENGQLFDLTNNLNATIVFTCSGKMLMSSRVQRKLWEVDPATAAVTTIGPLAPAIGGMSALGTDLYALGVAGSEGLFTITESSAQSNRRSSALDGRNIAGGAIAFAPNGRLFAVFDLFPQRPALAELAPASGQILSEVVLTGPQLGAGNDDQVVRALAISAPVCAPSGFGGATAMPVPVAQPNALILLAAGLGLFALAALGRRVARPR